MTLPRAIAAAILILGAVLYFAFYQGANDEVAVTTATRSIDSGELTELRTGEMRKLVVHNEAKPIPAINFTDTSGKEATLADFKGKYILLNFWATWCAPCRAEMPSLDALQKELGGDDFQVVLIATGRNPAPAISSFFDEIKISSLETHLDPKQAVSAAMGVFGLPVTVLIDPAGNEIARMRGDADWHGPDAVHFLKGMLGMAQASG